ncbi:NAD(P)H-hydrate dehydratase [Massilia sp. GCM10020059]|uniref:Bifunctional NAD(P)H-hydrate repair enzyme n=1 Tax=Massilia agrisoli TaxID=2892444 RepID=A0ABS8IX91_9BURK|nr:NAD(P)H-hydrate dehydratase [Massilia agrisoli]MCC6072513.1 NAD(P)H-hydrate dehydratase [Massilia agrisoli]
MGALYSVAEIRQAEQAAAAQLPPGALMQRAGQAAARIALDLLGGAPARPVLVLAGPGNNGGDAFEVAANLAQAGVDVAIVHIACEGEPSAETAHALGRARASTATFADSIPDDGQWSLIVDGLFGIGLARPLEGAARAMVEAVNAVDCTVLALDVPSGLDADSGAVLGPDGVAVIATHTVTFIGDKPGLHTYAGRDYAGEVMVARLGIDEAMMPGASIHLNEPPMFELAFVPRLHASHKGSFGDVAVVGGAHGMAGAPILAARAALFSGAGRVYVASVDHGPAYDNVQPELMFRDAATHNFAGSTVVAGPGMGDSATAIRILAKLLDGESPLVLDADAINLVAASPDLQSRLSARHAPSILTPHPLEAARLLGVTAGVVQGDRLEAAREIAARFDAFVVLKGSGTVIAMPDGEAAINPTGNPGLASAGTGDVLAGLCGSLLAQGWPARDAALAAVWMHGQAADRLVAQGVGPIGLTAGELPAAIRTVLNRMVAQRPKRGGQPQS